MIKSLQWETRLKTYVCTYARMCVCLCVCVCVCVCVYTYNIIYLSVEIVGVLDIDLISKQYISDMSSSRFQGGLKSVRDHLFDVILWENKKQI